MTVLLTELGDFTVTARPGTTDGVLWLDAADAERATGWTLKPEGMCRGDVCVPLPARAVRPGAVDLAAFWRSLDNPLLSDTSGDVWALGIGPDARTQALAGDEAPDIVLPDLASVPHRLSALRGKKVFLATWASW
jgi:hypothetical protein